MGGQAARGRLRTPFPDGALTTRGSPGRYWTVLPGLKAASLVVGSTPRGLPALCFGEQDARGQAGLCSVRVWGRGP